MNKLTPDHYHCSVASSKHVNRNKWRIPPEEIMGYYLEKRRPIESVAGGDRRDNIREFAGFVGTYQGRYNAAAFFGKQNEGRYSPDGLMGGLRRCSD